jgi:hypothetical protein
LQQIFGALGALFVSQVGMRHVLTGMGLDELLHQPVDRPANRRYQVQGLGAIGLALQRFLDGLYLAGNASYTVEQLVFMFMNVRHTYTPYPYMARIVADGLGNRKHGELSGDERNFENDLKPCVGVSLLAIAICLIT